MRIIKIKTVDKLYATRKGGVLVCRCKDGKIEKFNKN